MAHLILLATGGTIATRAGAGGRRVGLTAADLLERTAVPAGVTVEPVDAAGRLSFAAGPDDLVALAAAVRAACARADGVVLTHGTDTLEETAALLALTHDGATPVTLTGAQRAGDDPAPDGPGNLAAALRWAAHGVPGVTVTFAGRVWPAIGARKTHSLDLDAFAAPGRGPLATVDAPGGDHPGGLRVHAAASTPALGEVPEHLPRVDVVAQYVGADAHAIDAATAAGARGIVLAALGAGNTTPPVTDAATRLLAAGTPVAVTSRTGAGPVAGLYAGGGADLARAGALFAGDLSPWQARMLLAVALAVAPEDPTGAARAWLRAAGVVADAPETEEDTP